jgi:hypothetical protein
MRTYPRFALAVARTTAFALTALSLCPLASQAALLPAYSAINPASLASVSVAQNPALQEGYAGSHITISCQGGPVPGLGTLSGTAAVNMTYYQGPARPGDVLQFERISQFSGQFTFTTPSLTGPGMTSETVIVSGALEETKFAAHGEPMHLVGISTRGRMLEIDGDEYYAGYLRSMPFYTVTWNGMPMSLDCSVAYE